MTPHVPHTDEVTGEPTYNTAEAAQVSGRSVRTVRKHIRAGRLAATRVSPIRGHWQITESDLRRWMRGQAPNDAAQVVGETRSAA